MSKKVHEIASELNRQNKEVIEFLREKGVSVASHESPVEEAHEAMVKEHFASEPKKKHIVQVFRPQNSRQGGRQGQGQRRPDGQRPQGQGQGQRRPEGQRPAPAQKPAAGLQDVFS